MKKINQVVHDFLSDQVAYSNKHTVEFTTFDDESVSVSSGWPGITGAGDLYLELCFESETTTGFVETFRITTVDNLENITPVLMLHLFNQGHVELCCAIDKTNVFYQLRFSKHQGKIRATNEKGALHEADVLLETARQFMDYTEQQYQLTAVPEYI